MLEQSFVWGKQNIDIIDTFSLFMCCCLSGIQGVLFAHTQTQVYIPASMHML